MSDFNLNSLTVTQEAQTQIYLEKLAKSLASNVKEEIWFNVTFRFKKKRGGEVLVCGLSEDEKKLFK
jgi:cell fate regulator YaaT (PSP1 superfamily)